MDTRKNIELKIIFWTIAAVFSLFLALPLLVLLGRSFVGDQGVTLEFYRSVIADRKFLPALGNSFLVAAAAALAATVIAFVLAYMIHYTNAPLWLKQAVRAAAMLPMFLPTITYGFAIIYSFGKQGLITRLLGTQLFDLYGFMGLMTGYVIYTIPVAFLLIHNTMGYIDKKTLVVSKVMGDGTFSTFWIAVVRPLLGTLAGAFIQAFFLSFTDFGIPASVGGSYDVVAAILYNKMIGGIPDFNRGAVVAVIMLIPSIGSICILRILERFNIRYNRISDIDLKKDPARDISWGTAGSVLSILILSIFAVIFVVPLVEEWPYQTSFSLEHFAAVFTDSELITVYWHSLVMALLTAFLGTLAAYGAALITARSTLPPRYKRVIESIALVTNAIPGMVLGVAYLFLFSGSGLQNTLLLMILGLAATVVFQLCKEPMLYLFGATENTIGYSMDYLNIYLYGSIFVELALGLNFFITSQGFSTVGMASVIIGAVVNIVLDPILIFGLNMGVKGAALATITAQAVSAVWVVRFLCGRRTKLRIQRRLLRLDAKVLAPVLALGLSPFIMQSTESLVNIAFNSSLKTYGGDPAVGAMTICSSIMQVFSLLFQGLSQGAQPIVGYNYGAGQLDRVKRTFRLLFFSSLCFSCAACAALELFPGLFVSLFNDKPELVEIAVWALHIYAAGMFMLGVQFSCQQTFVALGQTRVSLFLALLRKVILLIPLILLLPRFLSDQVFAVFLAEPVADILAATTTGAIFFWRFPRILEKRRLELEHRPT